MIVVTIEMHWLEKINKRKKKLTIPINMNFESLLRYNTLSSDSSFSSFNDNEILYSQLQRNARVLVRNLERISREIDS